MKTASIIAKILAALAAIAGVVYVIATYGDKIVAWAKNLLKRDECECDECCEECEEVAEEEAVEAAEEEAVVASDADFEG
jgi:hypothetical protein